MNTAPIECVQKIGPDAPPQGRLVDVLDVPFFSICEEHRLPFWGQASVVYYTGRKIRKPWKTRRAIDVFSRRFQVQDRLTREIGEHLYDSLGARAIVVHLKAAHLCAPGSETMTEFEIGVENLSYLELEKLRNAIKPLPPSNLL